MGPVDDHKAQLDAAKERREIVERYDRGRDPDASIDEWEDPAFEVYHTTDRYGFIHDSRLPSERDDSEKVAKEMERVTKWQKMYQDWDKSYKGDNSTKSEKLRARVRKGIPDKLRGEIWKKLLLIEDVKAQQKGVYEKMKERARRTSPDIRQIDLDVNRTYRNHIMFRERFGVKQTHLFHVLAAYSMYNTEVGYCQGMSQIAALLLMYMDEEDAFWGLSQLLTDKKHAMHGLFIPGFPKLMRYQNHFEQVLKKSMPKIYKFMNANMIPPSLYAIKWFMQCFLDRTPFPLTLRLWDIFMLDGERILVPMAFTIFKIHKKKLLKMPMERFVGFLQQELEKDFGLDDDAVITELEAVKVDLRRTRMDVPPKPTGTTEVPTKPFGCITYPTEEELLRRQEAQIHINDEPMVNSNSSPTKERPNAPRHLVSNDSFRSVYDNHPAATATIHTPTTPDTEKNISDGLPNSIITSQGSVNHEATPPPPVHVAVEDKPNGVEQISETLNTELVEDEQPSCRLSGESAISEVDVVELRLDLSEEDEPPTVSPPPAARQRSINSVFEKELEQTLNNQIRNSRSSSRSPEIELDDNCSHMYTRSAGFRSRNISPRAPTSRQSSDTEIPVTHLSANPQPRPPTPPLTSRLPVRKPPVSIPITHIPPPQSPSRQLSPRFPTHQTSPVGHRVTPLQSPASPTSRPFPVPRSHIPIMQNSRIPTSPRSPPFIASPQGNAAVRGLHMLPTGHAQAARPSGIPSPPRRQTPGSRSDTFQPATYHTSRPVGFHTFGGRGRHPRSPPSAQVATSPPTPTDRSFDSLQIGQRVDRFGSGRLNQTLPSANRTFYVVGDSNRSTNVREPTKYDFNEEDNSSRPVYL